LLTIAQRLCTLAADGPVLPGQPQDPMGSLYGMLMLLVPMGLFFYFFMIRPESKRRKEREQLLNSVKVKDKVVTIGGIHGTVVDVEKDEIVILVDPKKDVRLRFRRTAVDTVEPAEGGDRK